MSYGKSDPGFNVGQKVRFREGQNLMFQKDKVFTVTRVEYRQDYNEWFVYLAEYKYGGFYGERLESVSITDN